jgi:hypothetical protein
MRLIIADLARRTYRWPTAFMALGVALFWSGHIGRGGVQSAFAVSLAAVFMIGPLFVVGTPTPRLIWYLPVSRRDLWRSKWLVATVGSVMLTTTAKLPVMFLPGGRLEFSRLLLSIAYDFAYAGIGCGLFAMSALPSSGLRRHLWGVINTMRIVACVGGPFWALAIRHRLPTRWTDLSPVTAAMLAGALALSLASYFHTPGLATHLGHPLMKRASSTPRGRRTGTSRVARGAGLTGLPRLLVHEYAWSTGLGAFLVVTFGAMVFVAGALMSSPASYGGFLRMQNLLLFDDAIAPQRRQLFDLMVWFGLFAGTLVSRFPESIRHLRVLPIGASTLNLLLVGWPLVMLATVWAALLGLHYLVLGQPVASLRPASFLALAGSSALMRALSLRWPGSTPFIFSLSISVVPIIRLINGPSSGLMAMLGIGGLGAAAALNHFTLMRGSTYKRPPQVLGVATQRSA